GVYPAEIQKGAEEFATAKPSNIFTALPLTVCSSRTQSEFSSETNGHFRVVWLLHGPRKDDGGDSSRTPPRSLLRATSEVRRPLSRVSNCALTAAKSTSGSRPIQSASPFGP